MPSRGLTPNAQDYILEVYKPGMTFKDVSVQVEERFGEKPYPTLIRKVLGDKFKPIMGGARPRRSLSKDEQRRAIRNALKFQGGDLEKAAKALGYSINSTRVLCRKYNINYNDRTKRGREYISGSASQWENDD